MALSYQQSSDLMQNGNFMGRIKVACLHYATYIYGEASSVTAHNTRRNWAQSVFQNPQQQAMNIQPVVVMDPNVQSSSAGDGSDVDDAMLQSAVENAVNNTI
jgi:hypothetical protein